MSSWFNDNQRIGIILSSLGGLFTLLGVLFLFDRGLLAIGNLLFLSGVALVIGLQKTSSLFFQRRKLRGTIPFFCGIVLVLVGWTKIGILVEGFGFVNLFGNFFPPALAVLRRLPIIGSLLRLPPGLSAAIDRVVNSGRASNA